MPEIRNADGLEILKADAVSEERHAKCVGTNHEDAFERHGQAFDWDHDTG